jgi:hypothetical protein
VLRAAAYTVGVRVTLQREEDSSPIINNETRSAWGVWRDEQLVAHQPSSVYYYKIVNRLIK